MTNDCFSRAGRRLAVVAFILSSAVWSADDPRAGTNSTRTTTVSSGQRGSPSRAGGGKGPLPDPALLDGSTVQAEKKSETGMIGDFELPGDDNAKSGKVGGPQKQNQGAAGEQGKNSPAGMPQGGGGAQDQQANQQQGGAQGGAQASAQSQAGAQAAGGGTEAGGPQNPDAAGKAVAGGGEQGAQPKGMQVASLGGEASGGGAQGDAGLGEKPKQVALGDSAMKIEQSATAPGVVGAQQQQVAGATQQHEKGTGSGGKGPGGATGGNRVEKGRAIPSGL